MLASVRQKLRHVCFQIYVLYFQRNLILEIDQGYPLMKYFYRMDGKENYNLEIFLMMMLVWEIVDHTDK